MPDLNPPPPPPAFFTLPDWRRFGTEYSQDAAAAAARVKQRRTARAFSVNQSANARAAPLLKRTAMVSAGKTCVMQLWSGEEYSCWKR